MLIFTKGGVRVV